MPVPALPPLGGPGLPASPGGSSAGPGPRGREPPGPRANGCGGMALPGRSRSLTGWKFRASPGRELGLRALKGSFIPALPRRAADTGPCAAASPCPAHPAPPARTMRRAPPLLLLLLLALLLPAAPPAGGSESPKGKQKALRQREVLDVVRAAGAGARGWGGRGRRAGRGGGRRSGSFIAKIEGKKTQTKTTKKGRFSEHLAAAPGRSGPGTAEFALCRLSSLLIFFFLISPWLC